MNAAIKDTDSLDMTVEAVRVNGDRATARVKFETGKKDRARQRRARARGRPLADRGLLKPARRSAQRAAVLTLVVGAVLAGADRLPPPAVLAVPRDGALEPVGEAHLRLPAERAHLVDESE